MVQSRFRLGTYVRYSFGLVRRMERNREEPFSRNVLNLELVDGCLPPTVRGSSSFQLMAVPTKKNKKNRKCEYIRTYLRRR
jgi:hypothetical protein